MLKCVVFVGAVFLGTMASAQTLVPATSEDLNDFDRQISLSHKNTTNSNFNAKVSEEAKRLQSQTTTQKKKSAKDSMDPRDKEDQSQLGASGNASNSAKDGKVSSPANSDHGNSANAPGHNKKSK